MRIPSLAAITALVTSQVPFMRIEIDRDTLMAGDKGFLVGMPVHVAGPGKITSLWSTDGRYLAVKLATIKPADRITAASGEEVPTKTSFIVWDSQTQASTEILVQAKNEDLEIAGWMGGSTALFIQGSRLLPSGPNRDEPASESVILRWTRGERTARVIRSGPGLIQIKPSPTQPYAMIGVYPDERMEIERVRGILEGDQIRPIQAGPNTYVELDAEGFFFITSMKLLTTTPKRTFTETWQRLLPGGKLVDLTKEPIAAPEEPIIDPNGLQVLNTTTKPEAGSSKAKVNSGWLWMPDKGKVKAVLVAAEASQVILAPSSTAVSYESQGNLMVRQIWPMTAKDLDGVLAVAEQEDLLNRVKQLGVAMAIYCADYDDIFPPNKDWKDLVMPYTKDASLMEGFVYEMNGENATAIDDPTKKRIGYIQGRYGRAIVFADTHAIWERRRTP